MVAVQVYTACRFEDALDLQHPLHHECDVCCDAVAVSVSSSVYQPVSAWALRC